jgi:hypothetical protein
MENNTDFLSQIKKTYPDAFEVPAEAGRFVSHIQLTDKVLVYWIKSGINTRLLFKPNLPLKALQYANYMGYQSFNPAYKKPAPNNMSVWQAATAKKWVERHSEAYDFIMDKYDEAKLKFDKKVAEIKGMVKYGMLVEGHPDFNEVGKITVQMTNGVYKVAWSISETELKADCTVTWEGDLTGLADISDFAPSHKPTWEALDLLGVIRLFEAPKVRLWFEVLKPTAMLSSGVCESVLYYGDSERDPQNFVREVEARKKWLESFDVMLSNKVD